MDDLKQWANKMVKIYNLTNAVSKYSDSVMACEPFCGGIHIYTGLDEVAEAVGKKICIRNREHTEYPYEYYFKYKGVEFYSLRKQ